MGFCRYALNEPSYNLPNVEKCIPIIFSMFLTYNEMSCTHILSVLIFFYMSCTAFQRHLEMSVFFFLKLSQIGNVTFRQLLRRNKRLLLWVKVQHLSDFGSWCFVYQEPTFLLPAWHVNLEGKYQSISVLVK